MSLLAVERDFGKSPRLLPESEPLRVGQIREVQIPETSSPNDTRRRKPSLGSTVLIASISISSISLVVDNHATTVLTALQRVKGLVDLVQRVLALDDVIDLDPAADVGVDEDSEGLVRGGRTLVRTDHRLLLAHHVDEVE